MPTSGRSLPAGNVGDGAHEGVLKLPLPDRQPVRPVSAEGERPITVEWELADPMPANLVRAGRIAS